MALLEKCDKKLREAGLKDASVATIMATLRVAMKISVEAGSGEPKSLGFLKNPAPFLEGWAGLSPVTQVNRATNIVSVLKYCVDAKWGEAALDLWRAEAARLKEASEEVGPPEGEMSERQADNWISMGEISRIRGALRHEVDLIRSVYPKPPLPKPKWTTVLRWFILCLFTQQAPRRNMDYMVMFVRADTPEEEDEREKEDRNWLCLEDRMFVFNNHKAVRKHGRQVFPIEDALMESIEEYLRLRPGRKSYPYPLLVTNEGQPLTSSGQITRALNACFAETGKKVGSQMLRPIIAVAEGSEAKRKLEKDAAAFGHDVETHLKHYMPKTPRDEESLGEG